MKNKGIIVFLILLAIVIIAVIAFDFLSKRPDKSEANPFEYNIDEFKNVSEELVKYKETKNFRLSFQSPRTLTIEENNIYVTGDSSLQIIDLTGKLLSEIRIKDEPQTVEVFENRIYLALQKQILVLRMDGKLEKEWDLLEDNTLITSMAAAQGKLYVGDAGKRRVIIYSSEGVKISGFEGKSAEDDLHGFIIPSPFFDLDVNPDGDLWVVNPGMHSFENYTEKGEMRTFWKNTSMKTDGFSGCCNPAHYALLPDGSFVTSEKGLVRIKVYKPSGEFSCVVAPNSKFENQQKAPDVATDNDGNIYALDIEQKVIRVFEPK